MPPVIAYIAAALVTYVGVSAAVATWIATLIVNAAIMFAAQKLLGKSAADGAFLDDVSQRTQMVRNATAPRRVIFGRCKVSGVLVFAQESGSKREYLHLVIVVASHQCDAILDVFINADLVPLDPDGQPIVGNKYRGFVHINKHLGASDQLADADLIAACPTQWTANHRLRGHAYLYAELKYDETVFPGGMPAISAVTRGMLITDPRDSVTRWTDNGALCIKGYMESQYGLVVQTDEFDSDRLNTALNIADEDVGLSTSFTKDCEVDAGVRHIPLSTQTLAAMDGIQPGQRVTGTGIPTGAVVLSINVTDDLYFFTIDQDPTASGSAVSLIFGETEKRYTCNGTIDSTTKAGDVLEAMLSCIGGRLVYAGGKWHLYVAAWQVPTISLSESDCRGGISVVTKLARRDLSNAVSAVFVSEAEGWIVTDKGVPAYAPAFYLAEDDGEALPRELQLPFTISPSTSQRLIKIDLERTRQQIVTRWPCKLTALKTQCGDIVMLNNERQGWVNKPFEVTSFVLVSFQDDKGQPAIGVDLVLRETAEGIYDWEDGSETTSDLSPNTILPNPFKVFPPSNLVPLVNATTSYIDNDGVHVPRALLTWDQPPDQYILSGGVIEEQYRVHGAADWLDWASVPGIQTQDFITDVKAGFYFDFRIRSKSKRGQVSAWVDTLTAYPAGYYIDGDLVPTDPVTGFGAVGLPEAIKLSWILPDITVAPNKDLDLIEIYEQGTATPAPVTGTAATYRVGKETTFNRLNLGAGISAWYWARTKDHSRNPGAWVGPVTATAQNGSSYAIGQAAAALSAANTAQTTANGKNTVFRQGSTPTAVKINDIWIDTTSGQDNKVYSWNGTSWEERFVPFLRLDSNNNVSGLIKVGGVSKDFILVADKFQVWDGVAPQVPFEIVGGVVYIKESFIQYLTADKIAAGNITVGLNITSGSLNAGSGANAVAVTSSGMTVGDTSGQHMKLKGGISGFTSVEFYNGASYKGGMGFDATGNAVSVAGTSGNSNSAVGLFWTANFQLLRALNSANPRTSDAPLSVTGGSWLASDVDIRGQLFGKNGSASSPAFVPRNGDSNTGIFSDEDDKLKFSCGGTEMGRFVNSGGSLFLILESGVQLRLGNTRSLITTETLQYFVTALDSSGNSLKLAVVA